MHEISTCRTLIKQVEKTVQDCVGFKIISIDVSVGQLSNINVRELEGLFPLVSVNTIVENAKLNIYSIAPDISCLDCGKDSQADSFFDRKILICAFCNSKNTIPLNGTDMLLTNVELESE